MHPLRQQQSVEQFLQTHDCGCKEGTGEVDGEHTDQDLNGAREYLLAFMHITNDLIDVHFRKAHLQAAAGSKFVLYLPFVHSCCKSACGCWVRVYLFRAGLYIFT